MVSIPRGTRVHDVLLELYSKTEKERDGLPVQGRAWVGREEGCHNLERPPERKLSKSAFLLDDGQGLLHATKSEHAYSSLIVLGCVGSWSTAEAQDLGKPESKSELCPILPVTFTKLS